MARSFKGRRLRSRKSLKHVSFKRRRTTKRLVRRSFKKRAPYKKGKGGHVVAPSRYHGVLARRWDKDRMIFEQTLIGTINWTPVQIAGVGGALGDHTDGFAISMNSLANAFGLGGNIGTNNGGIPTGSPPAVNQIQWVIAGTSGTSSAAPDGLVTAFNRYTYMLCVGGVMDLRISQDTPGTSTTQGSIKVGVCGFPSTIALTPLGSTSGGHLVYPTGTSGGAANEASFAGLANEPNARTTMMTPFAGSKTTCHIRYPFSIAKFVRPGYQASSGFYQVSAANGGLGNPGYASFQPFILTQLLSDGNQAQVLRCEIKMKWYVMGFDRKVDVLVS